MLLLLLLLQGSSGMLLAVAQPYSPALGLLHVEEHAARSIISIAAHAHALNALRVLLLQAAPGAFAAQNYALQEVIRASSTATSPGPPRSWLSSATL